MIKINSRRDGDMWINHKHIISVNRHQSNPVLWTTQIVMSDDSVIYALDECSDVLNRIEEAKQKEIELRRF
jgi:hypothetical protein